MSPCLHRFSSAENAAVIGLNKDSVHMPCWGSTESRGVLIRLTAFPSHPFVDPKQNKDIAGGTGALQRVPRLQPLCRWKSGKKQTTFRQDSHDTSATGQEMSGNDQLGVLKCS